jgi:hypothetical protein
MRRTLGLALEAIFVIAVAVVGLVLLPFFLVYWGVRDRG